MSLNPVTLACRSCRFYTPEGRRGGHCQQLGVPVRGGWSACSLALPPFAPSWESLEELLGWQKEVLMLQEVLPLESSQLEEAQPLSTATCKSSEIEALPLSLHKAS